MARPQLVHRPAELRVDEPFRRRQAAVEIDGRHDRLERIRNQRRLFAAPAPFLAASKQEILPEPERGAQPCQRRCGHENGLGLRLAPLVIVGELVEQPVGDDQVEHRIAEELHRLVVGHAAARVLMGAGSVRQRMLEQTLVPKHIAEPPLQRGARLLPEDILGRGVISKIVDHLPRDRGLIGADREAHFAGALDVEREDRVRQIR